MENKYELPVITNTNLIYENELDGNHIYKKEITNKHNNKILMLLSGGIDSPVASYLLLRAGYKVDFLHFTTEIDKIENIKNLRNILNPSSTIYVIDFKSIQDEIIKKCRESYRTIMYKIFMILIANSLSQNKYNYDIIATGNSLGQVASQTIQNIKASNLVSILPLISPLFGYNKDSIIEIAKIIGTYKPSICDGTNDCCVMYMPKFPVTDSKFEYIVKCILKFDNLLFDNLFIQQF